MIRIILFEDSEDFIDDMHELLLDTDDIELCAVYGKRIREANRHTLDGCYQRSNNFISNCLTNGLCTIIHMQLIKYLTEMRVYCWSGNLAAVGDHLVTEFLD